MKQIRMAVPAGILLLALAVPTMGQKPDDAAVKIATPPSAGQSQDATATATPAATTPAAEPRVLTIEERADLLMARKEYRDAAEVYKTLIDQHPRNAVYQNKLGIALHQQMDLGGALKYYKKAVKLDPKYADAQNNIGTIWYQRKKYGKAVKAYKKALKIRLDMPVVYSNLGYAYFSDKKYEQSIAAFRSALVLDPLIFEHNSSRTGSLLQDRSVTDRGRFYYLLAKSFAESGNYDRCILYLRKAKDEGYKEFMDVKKDPAFTAILKVPEVQIMLAPKPEAEPVQQP